jgi:hypothetical protein
MLELASRLGCLQRCHLNAKCILHSANRSQKHRQTKYANRARILGKGRIATHICVVSLRERKISVARSARPVGAGLGLLGKRPRRSTSRAAGLGCLAGRELAGEREGGRPHRERTSLSVRQGGPDDDGDARREGRGAARSTADAGAGALSTAGLRDGVVATSALGGSMGRQAGRKGGRQACWGDRRGGRGEEAVLTRGGKECVGCWRMRIMGHGLLYCVQCKLVNGSCVWVRSVGDGLS